MICDKHLGKPVSLGKTGSDRQHYAVAERHDRRPHILVGIMTVGNRLGSIKKRAMEILSHESENDLDKLDAEFFTMIAGTGSFSIVVV